ncbi:MBL fold metallo-hydrolase RNA specificity domain-containing protein [Psychrosphaera aestuarii]|uniref:MBL fold metallo-hydrolase RNA specificity domain-containing protein n=1 Tax=Psychrosphaera aestuarii TaxID=1266052 RepID=UPI001B320DF1|nr:MBL fold metallo-hydrolase [Psychrosphaera aestuarii]
MAELIFYGAVEGVTGSMYLLKTENSSVLLDSGLFQGRRDEEKKNHQTLPFDLTFIDAVIISHAHLDHSGRIPLLINEGYDGPIFMTRPTLDLVDILLKDAGSLQERDAEWENKKRRRAGKKEIDPIYTQDDAERAMNFCVGVPYCHRFNVTDDIELNYRDAGHILGSAIVEIWVDDGHKKKKLVFSGDLGNSQAALLNDPAVVSEADILLIESTYGDREHKSMEETLDEFKDVILQASRDGGNILIPSFAVGRTQEIIFRLGELYQEGLLTHQVAYLDSPMAIAVTEVYHKYQNTYNDEDQKQIQDAKGNGRSNLRSLHSFLPILRYSQSTKESMAINNIVNGAIIIAGSGMCNGGRIRHHFKHNLWRRQSHVVFVGYQAEGTPGRALVDGAKTFKLAGETIAVNAQIHTLGGFSAHASQSQLLSWLSNFSDPKPHLYIVHGETLAKEALKNEAKKVGWHANIPQLNDVIYF